MFKFITHDNRDAYFNLASEEYLLKQTDGFYFYLWINDPAVIVGVNQNALQEVNLGYTKENSIKVVRRLTGGGAVYHDSGNLCYTVIAPYNDSENNYVKFTAPVIEYLNSLGVKAEFSGRNDITVDGKKISGNAQTVYNNRIMHHGTILFSTDPERLKNSLNPSKLKIESKGIKSIRARVTNVKDHLKTPLTIEQFKQGLSQKLANGAEICSFSALDIAKINKLVEEKYSLYEWNIGKSPKGKNKMQEKFPFGIVEITFDTENGKIFNAEITGDFFSLQDVKPLSEKLNGVPFTFDGIKNAISDVDKYIVGANANELAKAFFD